MADGAGGDGFVAEEAGEVGGEGVGAFVAVGGGLFEALAGDHGEVAVDRGAFDGSRQGGGRVVADSVEEGGEVVAEERGAAGEPLVEDGAQGIDVGGDGQVAAALGLLGGHVAGGADQLAGVGERAVGLRQPLGEAEVGDIRIAMFIREDVRGFEVAVQDPPAVGVVDGQGHVAEAGGLGAGVEPRGLGEIAAGDVLHREVLQALMFADFIDRHDVRMVERGHRLGLGAEAGQVARGGERASEDHLERDHPVEARLIGPIDDPHPAVGYFLFELVIAEIADR